MKNRQISNELRSFLNEYIRTAQQLEVLLTVAEVDREWTVQDISHKLGLAPTSASNRLMNLWAKGLIQVTEKSPRTYRFSPDEKLGLIVEKLRSAYQQQRAQILGLIDAALDK